LAKKGMRAVVIERKHIGGSCPNIIERNARVAHREDEDVSDALYDMFREEGIA